MALEWHLIIFPLAGQPLLSPQNNVIFPPGIHGMPNTQGMVVPVTGAPPMMIRPVDSGNPSLPPGAAPGWNIQPNQQPPHQIGGPPPPAATPTSNMTPHPPTSATPPTMQPPNNQPPPHQMLHAGNGNAAASAPNVYFPGSVQPQSLPPQFPYGAGLIFPNQAQLTALQQPIMSQAQHVPVTSSAGFLQQLPYAPVHQSHQGT